MIGEFLSPKEKSYHSRTLFLTEHRIIGPLEIHEYLSPEKVRIRAHLVIERPRASDTLSLLLSIMRNPAIHSVKLEPEDDSIATENLRDSSSLHSIEIIYCLHRRPKPLTIPTSNIWDLRDRQRPKESLNALHIEVDIRAIGFIKITEHLGSDPSIGYPD